ncbi:MAG: FAD-dependent oxidoreductase [Alphaproteobacteria bacterium]
MADKHPDIVIIGAGIAGLWSFHRLKALGYDVLLLEKNAIGSGQTIASQGIIHSGLKYSLAGKVNKLARNISAMPDRWLAALHGEGEVNLTAARLNADSHSLLIPAGFMGAMVKLITSKTLGQNIENLPASAWPEDFRESGFIGNVIKMGEPVFDIPSVIRALAGPYINCIRKIDKSPEAFLKEHGIKPKKIIYTAAASNHDYAHQYHHDQGLKTQKRPLLMGFLKPAPFPLYAHFVSRSDKPLATITTHYTEDGTPVWYIGGQAAEREKTVPPEETIRTTKKAMEKYLPNVDLSSVQWATLPIDRIEGSSTTQGWMPDTPTIHDAGDSYYCWPTKLTFAPLLSDYILEKLEKEKISPSHQQCDWSFLPEVGYTKSPWDEVNFSPHSD